MPELKTIDYEGTPYPYTLERQERLGFGEKKNAPDLVRACAEFLGADVCGEFRQGERAALSSLRVAMRRVAVAWAERELEEARLAAWNTGGPKIFGGGALIAGGLS